MTHVESVSETSWPRHCEKVVTVAASAEQVFMFIDDHRRLASHMAQSSWMMAGSRMPTDVDSGLGQRIGSHITMRGTILGLHLSLDEVVTQREPPLIKVWQTVGTPQLIVIGSYRMGAEVQPHDGQARLRVFIDYELPLRRTWLGRLFGDFYARWCVTQMADGAVREFATR